MDKFRGIRPIALGIVVRDGKVLASEGFDKVKGNRNPEQRIIASKIWFRQPV